MISQMKAIEDENRFLKKMFAELSMQSELLKEAFGKIDRSSQRREMAETAVRRCSIGIALALVWPLKSDPP